MQNWIKLNIKYIFKKIIDNWYMYSSYNILYLFWIDIIWYINSWKKIIRLFNIIREVEQKYRRLFHIQKINQKYTENKTKVNKQ